MIPEAVRRLSSFVGPQPWRLAWRLQLEFYATTFTLIFLPTLLSARAQPSILVLISNLGRSRARSSWVLAVSKVSSAGGVDTGRIRRNYVE